MSGQGQGLTGHAASLVGQKKEERMVSFISHIITEEPGQHLRSDFRIRQSKPQICRTNVR